MPPDLMRGYGAIQAAIFALLETARKAVARNINAAMTATYWEIGRRIVEFEQGALTVPLTATLFRAAGQRSYPALR